MNEPEIFLDSQGRLSQKFSKNFFTRNRALFSLEISSSLRCKIHPEYSKYYMEENSIWRPNHTKTDWVWYQEEKYK